MLVHETPQGKTPVQVQHHILKRSTYVRDPKPVLNSIQWFTKNGFGNVPDGPQYEAHWTPLANQDVIHDHP